MWNEVCDNQRSKWLHEFGSTWTVGNRGYSGIVDHAIDCSEEVKWGEARTIHTESRYFQRKVREALEIQKGNLVRAGSNQEYGQYLDHRFWLPIIGTKLTSDAGNHLRM
jgi:hypothetical protein